MKAAALGEPDPDFERQLLIARLQWNLESPALQIAGELRRDGLGFNAVNIETSLIAPIVNAKPLSAIVPWRLSDKGCSKNE